MHKRRLYVQLSSSVTLIRSCTRYLITDQSVEAIAKQICDDLIAEHTNAGYIRVSDTYYEIIFGPHTITVYDPNETSRTVQTALAIITKIAPYSTETT